MLMLLPVCISAGVLRIFFIAKLIALFVRASLAQLVER